MHQFCKRERFVLFNIKAHRSEGERTDLTTARGGWLAIGLIVLGFAGWAAANFTRADTSKPTPLPPNEPSASSGSHLMGADPRKEFDPGARAANPATRQTNSTLNIPGFAGQITLDPIC